MNKLQTFHNIKQKLQLGILLVFTGLVLTACFHTQKQQSNTTETTSKQNENQSKGQKVKGSLFDMMKLNKNMMCSYTSKDDEGNTIFTAEMFLSGKKIRSNVKMTDNEEKTIESFMVSDGEWFYIWSNASDKGTKFKIDEMEKSLQDATKDVKDQTTKNPDLNKVAEKFDYSCDSWIPDTSKFTVPSNVTFIDMQETLDKLKEQLGGFKEAGCNACNIIQDASAKAECLKNLGC